MTRYQVTKKRLSPSVISSTIFVRIGTMVAEQLRCRSNMDFNQSMNVLEDEDLHRGSDPGTRNVHVHADSRNYSCVPENTNAETMSPTVLDSDNISSGVLQGKSMKVTQG